MTDGVFKWDFEPGIEQIKKAIWEANFNMSDLEQEEIFGLVTKLQNGNNYRGCWDDPTFQEDCLNLFEKLETLKEKHVIITKEEHDDLTKHVWRIN